MIIVSGRIYLRPGSRDEFLEFFSAAVRQARAAPGCRDFVIAPDPIEPERVNVYEEWESEERLLAFRGDGSDEAASASIVSADVHRHRVASSQPA